MNNKDKMIDVLKQHDIELVIDGCGCCGSPWVTFKYKDEIIVDDEDNFHITLEDFSQNDSDNGSHKDGNG